MSGENQNLTELLDSLDVSPVLVDIGSSGEPPAIWDSIAKVSTFVGFDPDLREVRDLSDGRFRRAVTLNEAVTSSKDDEDITFFLTVSPYCSSTLLPDKLALSQYIFSDLFDVERQVSVRATTLERALDRLQVPVVDWIKIDSQGTDLRLFTSLPSRIQSQVLALDVEPGLIDAYRGEDLFVDTHSALTKHGFWLSFLNVQGAVRVKKSTRDELDRRAIGQDLLEQNVRRSPGWCECRYLRTIESLADSDASERQHVLLWLFAMMDGQFAFALDVAFDFRTRFCQSPVGEVLLNASLDRMRPRPLPQVLEASPVTPFWARWLRSR